MPELREATSEDYAAVRRLYAQHTDGGSLSPTDYTFWRQQWTVAVAVDGETVLGFSCGNHRSGAWDDLAVTPPPPEHWACSYITHLVVDQAQRRRGVGSLLLRGFLDQAAQAGNSWVVLHPSSQTPGQTKEELYAFYTRNGFHHLRHRPDDEDPQGREIDHWKMGRQVSTEDGYEIAVLDGPYERPAPPPMPPETAQERDRRKEQIAELQRRYSGTDDHPLATSQPRGGQRRGF